MWFRNLFYVENFWFHIWREIKGKDHHNFNCRLFLDLIYLQHFVTDMNNNYEISFNRKLLCPILVWIWFEAQMKVKTVTIWMKGFAVWIQKALISHAVP